MGHMFKSWEQDVKEKREKILEDRCTTYSCPFCDEVDDSYERIIKHMLMRHPYLSEKLINALEEHKKEGILDAK